MLCSDDAVHLISHLLCCAGGHDVSTDGVMQRAGVTVCWCCTVCWCIILCACWCTCALLCAGRYNVLPCVLSVRADGVDIYYVLCGGLHVGVHVFMVFMLVDILSSC